MILIFKNNFELIISKNRDKKKFNIRRFYFLVKRKKIKTKKLEDLASMLSRHLNKTDVNMQLVNMKNTNIFPIFYSSHIHINPFILTFNNLYIVKHNKAKSSLNNLHKKKSHF